MKIKYGYYHEGILFNYFFLMHMEYLFSDIHYMSLLLYTGKVILHEQKQKFMIKLTKKEVKSTIIQKLTNMNTRIW